MATTTVKGLLKGLRYISRIFDDEDKGEEEMTIGFPTDVKHVAHIGWDGPTVNPPTWMNEFKKSPSPSSPGGGWRSDRSRATSTEDLTPTTGGGSHEKMSSRCRRATCSSSLAEECAPQPHSNNSKPTRHSRRQDCSDAAVASPSREEGSRRGKKQQQHTVAADHSSSVPKPNQGGHRKSKGSSAGGEARRSSGRRTKHSSSSTDSLPDPSKADPEQHSLPIIREHQQKRSKEPTKFRKDPTTPSSRRKSSSTPSHDFGGKPHVLILFSPGIS